jgi:hypothetical protein
MVRKHGNGEERRPVCVARKSEQLCGGVDPATRVSISIGPRSAAELCSTPAAPERMRRCTMNESSAPSALSFSRGSDALTAASSPAVTRT